MQHDRLVFVDLETGGVDPKRHPIIQLAAVAVDGTTLEALETLELKIRFDERKANKYALRKYSYSRLVWQREALEELEAAAQFSAYLSRHAAHTVLGADGRSFRLAQLVAHNAAFDGAFLQAWYGRLKRFCPARFQLLCTLQRAQWHFFENPSARQPVDFKLGTLCQHFGVPLVNAHDALGDVRATVGLYRALVAAAYDAPRLFGCCWVGCDLGIASPDSAVIGLGGCRAN